MESANDAAGGLFVISGPSGSGKTTIVERLKGLAGLFYSVSATSRAPRPGERDGVDYIFLSRDDFDAKIAAGEFAEHAEVAGNLYGTPAAPLAKALACGRRALVDIDVQGAMQLKKAFPQAKLIFIEPPSLDALADRLRKRGTESPESFSRRLELAKREMEYAPRYDFRVVNDRLETAVDAVRSILLG